MKATADRQALADALAWVSQVIAKRPQHPALGGIKVVAADGALRLSAFDYETSHAARVDAEIQDDGECFVPGQFLREVVTAMRGNSVDLVLDDKRLAVTAGRSSYGVQVMDPRDAPALPDFPTVVGGVAADDFTFMVAAVATSVDADPSIPLLMGINLSVSDAALHLAATKRFTLAAASCPWDGQDFACTAPGKGLQAAVRGFRGPVTIGHHDGLLGLRDSDRAVTMRTFDETESKFPIWRRALREPDQDKVVATVDLPEFIAALKLASTLAEDRKPIGLVFGDSAIEVATDGGELGVGTEVVDAEVYPPDGSIAVGMNVRYLLDVLTVIQADQVEIGLVDPNKSLVVRPVGHDRAIHLVQPKPLGGLR